MSASRPLQGLRVLNARPAGQADALTQALVAAGADVIELPLLAVEPLVPDAEGRDWLMALDRYDGVLVVSGNAARLGLEAVADYWPQWPHALPVFAVGAATAAVLDQAGLRVTTPAWPAREDSEGLLDLPALQDVSGQRWLLWRGEQGRELLAQTLRARGARVDVLPLYRLTLPADALKRWQSLSARPDVVLLSSPAVWQHWHQLAGAQAQAPLLLTASARLADIVRDSGATRVLSADGTRPEHWLQALLRWRDMACHG